MQIKKAYSLQEAILYLEALEMLDMIYKIEKYITYYDKEKDKTYNNVWIIEFEPADISEDVDPIIEFED
ncbi:hypothetical protein QO179_24220 [Bacillus stercoris]|nr:hypothetical protein [Bacillus stercoris]